MTGFLGCYTTVSSFSLQTLILAHDGKIRGALGNIVRQMHVHVIARFETDAAWPGPVWGQGTRVPYEREARDRLCADLLRQFG